MLFAATISISCGGGIEVTGPIIPGVPASSTHPGGVLAGRITDFTLHPFAVGVSSTDVMLTALVDGPFLALGPPVPNARMTLTTLNGNAKDIAFDDQGLTAFIATGRMLDVIDVARGAKVWSVSTVGPLNRVAMLPNSGKLLALGEDNRLSTVDTASHKSAPLVEADSRAQAFAVARSGAFIVLTMRDGKVWRINAASGIVERTTTLTSAAQDVAISANEKVVYVAVENAALVEVLDAATMQRIAQIQTSPLLPFGLSISPDFAQLYITSSRTGVIGVIDLQTRTLARTFDVGGTPRRIGFNRRGTVALVANEAGWVDVIQ